MRFLLDEMLPPSIAQQLRKRSIDALAVVERSDLRGADDADVLQTACDESRVVVTANIGDFVRLSRLWAAQGRSHAGVLLVTNDRFPQDSSRIGAITNALAQRVRADTHEAGIVEFLQPMAN